MRGGFQLFFFNVSRGLHRSSIYHFFADALFCQLLLNFQLSTGLCACVLCVVTLVWSLCVFVLPRVDLFLLW